MPHFDVNARSAMGVNNAQIFYGSAINFYSTGRKGEIKKGGGG